MPLVMHLLSIMQAPLPHQKPEGKVRGNRESFLLIGHLLLVLKLGFIHTDSHVSTFLVCIYHLKVEQSALKIT